jgi:hypothetical protein
LGPSTERVDQDEEIDWVLIGAIIGGVCACLIIVAIIIGVCVAKKKRRIGKDELDEQDKAFSRTTTSMYLYDDDREPEVASEAMPLPSGSEIIYGAFKSTPERQATYSSPFNGATKDSQVIYDSGFTDVT